MSPLTRWQMAGKDAHKGGLARTVPADDSMDAAGLQRNRDRVEHLDCAE